MSKIVPITLIDHQAKFIADTTTRDLALVGGRGSGKTYALCLKLISLSMLHMGLEGAALSPTGPMASKVLIPGLLDALDQCRIRYDFNKQERRFKIYMGSQYTTLNVLSAENIRDALGLNLAFFGMDEADTIPPDVALEAWRKLKGALRVGDKEHRQAIAVSTPEGHGFMYRYWKKDITDENRAMRRIIHGDSRNNTNLDAEFFADLEATYPAHYLDAYIRGQFVNMTSGSVYPDYNPELNNTALTYEALPSTVQTLHLGMDFNVKNEVKHPYGIYVPVTAILDGHPYVIDEIYGYSRTSDVIKEIKRRYKGKNIFVYPDPSGAGSRTSAAESDRAQLTKAGFIDRSPMGSPRIIDRVNAVSAQILNGRGERRLRVNRDKCPVLAECLEHQPFDKRSGDPEKDTGFDDPCDALGYFINVNWPIKDSRFDTQPLNV